MPLLSPARQTPAASLGPVAETPATPAIPATMHHMWPVFTGHIHAAHVVGIRRSVHAVLQPVRRRAVPQERREGCKDFTASLDSGTHRVPLGTTASCLGRCLVRTTCLGTAVGTAASLSSKVCSLSTDMKHVGVRMETARAQRRVLKSMRWAQRVTHTPHSGAGNGPPGSFSPKCSSQRHRQSLLTQRLWVTRQWRQNIS